MFENFCSDIIQIMKCFALESFNLSCQAEHTKINSRLNFNPGLALIAFWTTRPWTFNTWWLHVEGRVDFFYYFQDFFYGLSPSYLSTLIQEHYSSQHSLLNIESAITRKLGQNMLHTVSVIYFVFEELFYLPKKREEWPKFVVRQAFNSATPSCINSSHTIEYSRMISTYCLPLHSTFNTVKITVLI